MLEINTFQAIATEFYYIIPNAEINYYFKLFVSYIILSQKTIVDRSR